MLGFLRFFFVVIVASSVVVIASLIWPRLTTNPRPGPIAQVNDILRRTPMGLQVANVLGVSDESASTPIDFNMMAQQTASVVGAAIQKKAASIAATQAVRALIASYEALEDGERQQIQEVICIPSPSPAPTPSV